MWAGGNLSNFLSVLVFIYKLEMKTNNKQLLISSTKNGGLVPTYQGLLAVIMSKE